jgi:type II secretion system protein N
MGPGVRATDVRVESGGSNYRFDHASLRAAWSTSWLRGRPAVHADIDGPLGAVVGTYTMGPGVGWEGVLDGVDLAAPPIRQMLPTVHLTGIGGAEMDVVQGLSGPEGWVRFELTEGSIAFGDFPLAVPFETIAGSVTLGNESYLTIEELKIAGPLLTADVTGSIESAPRFADAQLQLQVQVEAQSDVQFALASAGVRFDKEGSARVRISGTPRQPRIH